MITPPPASLGPAHHLTVPVAFATAGALNLTGLPDGGMLATVPGSGPGGFATLTPGLVDVRSGRLAIDPSVADPQTALAADRHGVAVSSGNGAVALFRGSPSAPRILAGPPGSPVGAVPLRGGAVLVGVRNSDATPAGSSVSLTAVGPAGTRRSVSALSGASETAQMVPAPDGHTLVLAADAQPTPAGTIRTLLRGLIVDSTGHPGPERDVTLTTSLLGATYGVARSTGRFAVTVLRDLSAGPTWTSVDWASGTSRAMFTQRPGDAPPGRPVALPDGRLAVVWARHATVGPLMLSVERSPGGPWTRPRAITRPDVPVFRPGAATDAHGDLVVTWGVSRGTGMFWLRIPRASLTRPRPLPVVRTVVLTATCAPPTVGGADGRVTLGVLCAMRRHPGRSAITLWAVR